jgi:hypothetical protein
MVNNRIHRVKVSRAGVTDRKYVSKSSLTLNNLKLIKGRTLDYGCGYTC